MSRRRQFGRVRKLPSGRWQARYLDPRLAADVAAPKTFERKADAEVWLSTMQADLHRGALLDPRESRLSFGEWADRWLAAITVKPSTRQQYESTLRVHVRPAFGHRVVSHVTYSDSAAYVKSLEVAGHGPGTVAAARKVLRLVFAEAERADAIRRNPASDLRVKRGPRDEMTFLSADEVEVLATAVESSGSLASYGLLVRVAAWTGVRAGELAALRVGRVNPLRGFIEIAEPADDRTGEVIFGPTKTYERRSVPVPPALAEELGAYLVDERPRNPDALVFTSPMGGPLSHRNFYRRVFTPAVARAGITRRMRFHDLRHTAAALMIAEGAHALAVKERLGHSSIAITMDRYGHLFPSVEAALTDLLDAAYRAARLAGRDEVG